MQAKIIGRSVVPNRFTLYEQDVNSTQIVFTIQKINDGVDLASKNAYLSIERDDGSTDKFLLEKTVVESEVYLSILINQSITLKEGIVRGQISFEKQDKSEVYKTEVFIFDVIDGVDGNSSFNNVLPSVIDELENNLNKKVEDCQKCVEDVEKAKTEIENKINDASNNAVLSINGQKGNVVLNYESVGAMPANGTLPVMQRTKYPLTIDGVSFDGTNEVSLKISGDYIQNDEEECVIEIEDKGVYYASNPKTLNIVATKFDSQTKEVSSTLYAKTNEGFTIRYSGNLDFCGEDSLDGNFMPKSNCVYKIEFCKLPNSYTIYAKTIKYKKTSAEYTEKFTFPYFSKVDEDGFAYNYGMTGNMILDNNNLTDPDKSMIGVGDLVEDYYSDYYGKYAVNFKTITNNYIIFKNFEQKIGDLTISVDEKTGILTLNGRVSQLGTVEVPISGSALKGAMATFRVHYLGGLITTTSLQKHIGIEFYDSLNRCNYKGQITGDCKFSIEGKESVYQYYKFRGIVFTFTENSLGSLYDNVQFGFGVEYSDEDYGFETRKEEISTLYLDRPLIGYSGIGDELNVLNGTIVRRFQRVYITDKSQLSVEEGTKHLVYKGENGQGLIANGIECDDSLECPAFCTTGDEGVMNTIMMAEKDRIVMNKNWFGEYEYIENSLPIYFVYALKTPNVERLKCKTPIKLLKGYNKITIESSVKPMESFIRQVKKN